ncbi:MAG: hypothetical protein JW963_16000 [Anaerolineales bacterium]|nr:hypothetical protein [Anaerolineales bacterium]
MSRLFKSLLVSALVLLILACNIITSPINDIENVASTAEAFASEMPFETVQALASVIPVQTIEALPSAIPDVGNYFDPSGTPVDQWNGIPVMPEATVGEEFGESTYSYTVPASATDVQAFYTQKMGELGWTSPFGFQASEEGGILFFQSESEFLTITIVPDQNGSNSVDVILQK